MADPHTWVSGDISEAVKALNAGASTFSGVQFVGWISGMGGAASVTVKDPSLGPTAYGMVRLGRVLRTQEFNGTERAPFRDSEYLIEVYLSSLVLHHFDTIFGSARYVLVHNLPVLYDVQSQLWSAPQEYVPPSGDVAYYSGLASVPYYAA